MRLSEEQKTEIKEYIVTVPRFRETFNELYDHLLNSIENNDVEYSIDEVNRIVNLDFGGFSEIVNQEKRYQAELSKKYNKHFRQEILNTFKWPSILSNLCMLALCLLIYFNTNASTFNMKPLLMGIIICVFSIAIFGFFRIISNRIRYTKYSILDNYFGYACSFGVIMTNVFIHSFNKENSWGISDQTRLLILLFLFFFCAVYVRSYFSFYNKKYPVLTYN